MESNSDNSVPPKENPLGVQPDAAHQSTSALDTFKGQAPLLEAYANYKGILSSAPTLLRSERRQAGKKEYVIGGTQLEQILEQALGLSESIPVTPATIISGLREMREECQKRKQGELLFPPI
ncbi:hypothetical protein VP01_5070g4 [Puccinia sorghi]|uniref:Uncharacterized protein n=1 Tax=Puccinia sorghi TaxID=27349 RepID=A0A0L6UM83_9BASI|nr:hypothetical protein VP01_5070g3 [Puccinia sorghi]KNZ49352.1 hypothetical protein VP01_5070g4 [Puccinia sorghi]